MTSRTVLQIPEPEIHSPRQRLGRPTDNYSTISMGIRYEIEFRVYIAETPVQIRLALRGGDVHCSCGPGLLGWII